MGKTWGVSIRAAALAALFIFAPALFAGAGEPVVNRSFRTVRTLQELDNIRNDLTGSYILMNDIDASATRNWNGGAGWEPIGSHGERFSGIFDGGGHTISGLYINRPGENGVGLFGAVGRMRSPWDPTVIRNVRLEGMDIRGGDDTGGLVGCFLSQIDSYVSGSYTSGRVMGGRRVGGLVGGGGPAGGARAGMSMSKSYSAASVTGRSEVGGLAGYNGGRIEESFFKGSVEGQEGQVGGLVGNLYYTSSRIINSYSTANVRGGRNVGGLVGLMRENSRIQYSYSTGTVAGESDVGGLVGSASGGSITASYWDTESSGMDVSSMGWGKTTREMTTHATFYDQGWDFENVWAIMAGESYPFPRWQLGIAPLPVPENPPFPGPIPDGPDGPGVPDIPDLPDVPHIPDPRPLPPENLRAAPGDGRVTLTWDESPSSRIQSYRIYSRVPESLFTLQASVPADTTEYVDAGLTNNVTYIYAVRSFSELGLESGEASNTARAVPGTDESGEDAPPPADEMPPPEGEVPDEEDDDSSGCFIATAAYGSSVSSEVVLLRAFRDGFLLRSVAGNYLVGAYYSASPALAEIAEKNSVLMMIARLHIEPAVKAAGRVLNLSCNKGRRVLNY